MEFSGARIRFNPRPPQQYGDILEVAMLGHCPGRVRPRRLRAFPGALEEIRLLGLDRRVDTLIGEHGDRDELYHLPIPLHSVAEFEDIFPDAGDDACLFKSRLAGDRAWLARAVEDFFANGGIRLWIIRVPEEQGIRGFLPAFPSPPHDTENLTGLSTALLLNNVGLVALPDLERIMIPPRLPDVPRKRLANPVPSFLPCTRTVDDGHRERRYSREMVQQQDQADFLGVLGEIVTLINNHRPDMQCLLSLPLQHSELLDSPAVDSSVLAALQEARTLDGAALLRRVQLLFPYLRSIRYGLHSCVGALAGITAASSHSRGIWRSVAGVPLITDARPYPAASASRTVSLREMPGVGIIREHSGRLMLDDERLTVPSLHSGDYQPGSTDNRLDGPRSGEVVRFLGFLLRRLKSLGERLIFNIDFDDPRPRLILEQFFMGLYRQGALRGKEPGEAFTIRRASVGEGVIAYDIEIAPAYPIDRIMLTFVNNQGRWLPELRNV